MEEGLQRSGSPMLNSRTIHSMPISSSPHTRPGMHPARMDSFRSEGGLRLSASAAQVIQPSTIHSLNYNLTPLSYLITLFPLFIF